MTLDRSITIEAVSRAAGDAVEKVWENVVEVYDREQVVRIPAMITLIYQGGPGQVDVMAEASLVINEHERPGKFKAERVKGHKLITLNPAQMSLPGS